MIQPGSHIHLVGICGTGLSAIARVLIERGYKVSGSDRAVQDNRSAGATAIALEKAGVKIYPGHRPENIEGADLVVRSSAVRDDNPEVAAARERGIPVLKRAEFLGKLMSGGLNIAVAGTHGKTTTTAMIAWMLTALSLDPSYIIGSEAHNLGSNAHSGTGLVFVIEADEYDRMFLGLNPHLAIVTNVEHDHPDHFPTPESYRQAFLEFAGRLSAGGILIACEDDPGAAALMEQAREQGTQTLGYGITSDRAVYRGRNLLPNESGGYDFDVYYLPPGLEFDYSTAQPVRVSLQAPGEHNVRNALAALAAAHNLELPLDDAARALGEFTGTGRRFEVIGEAGGVVVVDDYAHHPTEVRATLAAARARYPEREIWAVWQPHTFSRTRALLDEFAEAFSAADHVGVTDIYAAREPVEPELTPETIVKALRHPDAHATGSITEAPDYYLSRLKPGSVLLVLSAGDATEISRGVFHALKERTNNHA